MGKAMQPQEPYDDQLLSERRSADNLFDGPKSVPSLLVASVVIELGLDLFYLTRAVVAGDHVAIPGALGRTLFMGLLGLLAVSRRSRWARWLFAGFQYVTAAAYLVLTFFTVPGGQLTFEPVALAIFVTYLLLGIAASVGTVRPRREAGEATT